MVSILALFALLSLLLAFWQWVAAWQFPLHERIKDASFTPAVTLLKPLKGCDEKTLECLESWLKQDYPGAIQVLFGVARGRSRVRSVRQLIKEHPECNLQLDNLQRGIGSECARFRILFNYFAVRAARNNRN